jgi:hypothetical protein
VRSTAELVTRLDPSWLERAWQGHQGTLSLIRGPMKGRLGDVALRASNLAASLGPSWDGDWWLDDVDVAIFTLATLDNVKDSDAAMRVLIAAYGQHVASRRRETRRPSMLLFDEFGSLAGGRALAINIVERARSSGAGVLLSAQSAAGLGSESERERLIAASSAVIAFRSPMPAELAALAGSERVAEGAWSFDSTEVEPGRVTVTERHRARLDQDQVRAARVGEARIIAGGRVEAVRILQTNIDATTRAQAQELVAGLARPRPVVAASGDPDPKRGPAGAVASRDLPPPVQPHQGASPALRRPSGDLDRPGRSPVRRYRPPGAGGVGPPVDRAGLALEGSEEVTPNETP